MTYQKNHGKLDPLGKVLISACLMGQRVRYDGGSSFVSHPIIDRLIRESRLIQICPEVAGGLSVPRPKCEIVRSTDLQASGAIATAQECSSEVDARTGQQEETTSFHPRDKEMALSRGLGIKATVMSENGQDCSAEFLLGATRALEIVREHNICIAILKSKSPSCGNSQIYDGTFSGVIIPGLGVTANLLVLHGLLVLSELELDKLNDLISFTDLE